MRAARAAVNAAGSIQELQGARTKARTRKARSQAIRIKIISMGDAGVGKSCLIKRYCEEKFVQKYIGTIGVDYGVKVRKCCGLDYAGLDLIGCAVYSDNSNTSGPIVPRNTKCL
jgi:GTPase SAR1 family protein